MLINQYDSVTGAFVSSVLADPDPMNKSRWLIPAFSTTVALPDRTRYQWPFFVDGAWVLKPDYRRVALYRATDGVQQEILQPGIAPADVGLTTDARPSDEHTWQDGTGWVIDQAIVQARKKAAAMVEFDALMATAVSKNYGKGDAVIAGVLSVGETAVYRAWAKYQMDCVAVVQSSTFPDTYTWPTEPDEAAVAEAAETEATAEKAAQEAKAQEAVEQAAKDAATVAAIAAQAPGAGAVEQGTAAGTTAGT